MGYLYLADHNGLLMSADGLAICLIPRSSTQRKRVFRFRLSQKDGYVSQILLGGLRTHKRVYPKARIPKSASTEKRIYPKARIPKSTT
jgi:hypothetical protein